MLWLAATSTMRAPTATARQLSLESALWIGNPSKFPHGEGPTSSARARLAYNVISTSLTQVKALVLYQELGPENLADRSEVS